MGLEKYLYPEEKNNINKLSEVQGVLVGRREALFRIINNKKCCSKKEVKIKTKSSHDVKNNSLAYQNFLKSEGIIFNDYDILTVNVNKSNSYIDVSKDIIKGYLNLINNINNYSKNIYSDFKNGLSSIDKLVIIISDFNELSKELNTYSKNNNISKEFNTRILSFLGIIYSLNKLLNDSKGDIVDYYSYKSEILNYLSIIINNSKGILKTLQKK